MYLGWVLITEEETSRQRRQTEGIRRVKLSQADSTEWAKACCSSLSLSLFLVTYFFPTSFALLFAHVFPSLLLSWTLWSNHPVDQNQLDINAIALVQIFITFHLYHLNSQPNRPSLSCFLLLGSSCGWNVRWVIRSTEKPPCGIFLWSMWSLQVSGFRGQRCQWGPELYSYNKWAGKWWKAWWWLWRGSLPGW